MTPERRDFEWVQKNIMDTLSLVDSLAWAIANFRLVEEKTVHLGTEFERRGLQGGMYSLKATHGTAFVSHRGYLSNVADDLSYLIHSQTLRIRGLLEMMDHWTELAERNNSIDDLSRQVRQAEEMLRGTQEWPKENLTYLSQVRDVLEGTFRNLTFE